MTASRRCTAFTPRGGNASASELGACCGWSRNAAGTGCPMSISATGSRRARRWPTRRASRRSNAWRTASGYRSHHRRQSETGESRPSCLRGVKVMTLGMLSSSLFGDMFGTAAMRAIFGELAFLVRCAEVEAALARGQARLGIVPPDAAAAISDAVAAIAANPETLDLARLKRATETVGYPILPLVRQLADRAGPAGRWLHWGATTQDIMDTAAVLQIRAGLALIERDLSALRGHLAALARRYRDTPMAGRTHLQHAPPVTFGYKAAGGLPRR